MVGDDVGPDVGDGVGSGEMLGVADGTGDVGSAVGGVEGVFVGDSDETIEGELVLVGEDEVGLGVGLLGLPFPL